MKTLNKLATRRLLLAILTIAPLLAVTSCKDEMDYYEPVSYTHLRAHET